EGRVREAQEIAFVLANDKNAQPRDLARYVGLLLDDHRAPEAAPWLQKLVAADPRGFVTLSLRARYLASEKKQDEAADLIDNDLQKRLSDAKSNDDRAQVLLAAGRLYGELRMDEQAERVYKQLDSLSPTGYQSLALWLASRGRIDEAVELCL